ncbi:MAG: IPT/TIG domain-containing protein [Acidobacteria bacterium]|nr:IPT/TIG domain-containing protein [Acidobacteriota bacterium]
MRNFVFSLSLAAILQAQAPTAPVLQPRGVVNAFSQLPAPAVVGQGGLIHINGINLAPPEGWKSDSLPLPTQFGDPAVQVLINNRPAPIVEASPSRIVAQVPLETPNGQVNLVVRRGDQSSRPVRLQVQNLAPAIKSGNASGFGPAANDGSDGTLRLRATSLGPTDPRVPTGEAASDPATPRAAISVFVGGIQAETTASYSTTTPGEFVLEVKTPTGAKNGDAVLLIANNAEANLLTMDRGPRESEITFIPLPAGSPDLRNLRSSDVNGLFLNANAVRGTDTCYPSYRIDIRKKEFLKVDGCLTTAQAQAVTPFVDGVGSANFAAFEGPFKGTAQPGQPAPVSDKVRIFRPGSNTPVLATLPESAANLNGVAGGDFVAVVQGTAGAPGKAYRIDSETGAVEEQAAAGGGAGGGVNLQGLLQRFQNIDLGDGVNKLLSGVAQLNNQFVITVGDNIENPTKAKVAVLSAQGDIVSQRELPSGWLPIVAPAPQQQPGGPGGLPGGLAALRTPTPFYMDAQTRNYYVAVRNAEGNHGFAYFPPEGPSQSIPLPETWFFAGCVPNIPVFNLELSRGIALLGARSEDRTFKNPCTADGFMLFDLAARRFQAVTLPGAGKFNASGGADELNDFLIGSNVDPANRNTSDTFYALDGVNATVFRFDLPQGVSNFSGGARVPALNLIVAQANNRINGDAGLILFDLERTESRLLPTPEGFAAVNFLGVLPSIRRVVARGTRTGNAGTQILVYNLENGDLEIIPNPEGIAWIGSPIVQQQPGQPGQPGQQAVNLPVRLNAKSNSVEAIVFGEDRRQKGVVVIRVN